MRVAVCDDEKHDRQYLVRCLTEYDSLHQMEIKEFADAATFYADHQAERFDLALLDIEMPPPNGYDIAKKIVQTDKYPPLILFVTNSMGYTVAGYGIAFRYLVKPIDPNELNAMLGLAIKQITSDRFIFFCDGMERALYLQDIFYFEKQKHHVLIHTAQTVYKIRDSMQNVIKQIPPGCFAVPHIGYLVNLKSISSLERGLVCLNNQERVPISRRNYLAFTNKFYAHMRNK